MLAQVHQLDMPSLSFSLCLSNGRTVDKFRRQDPASMGWAGFFVTALFSRGGRVWRLRQCCCKPGCKPCASHPVAASFVPVIKIQVVAGRSEDEGGTLLSYQVRAELRVSMPDVLVG
jgi:hypothetical protein